MAPQYSSLTVGALGTNCYLLYDADKQAVVIDPGDEAERILHAIRQQGLQVRGVLLTHAHFDHLLATAAIQQATEAPLWIPSAEAAALNDPLRNLLVLTRGRAPQLHADRLLEDGDAVKVGALSIQAIHTPGHTPGSMCYLVENLLFTGDTLFEDSVGRTDFPGGDSMELRLSLQRLSALQVDFTVLPGHGASTTLERERRYNPYMGEACRL